MLRDYAGPRGGGQRRPAPRRRPPRWRGEHRWGELTAMPESAKLVLVLLLALALLSMLLTAWRVSAGHGELARQRVLRQELVEQRQELQQHRDELAARPRIEEEAARLGLYPPRPEQLL
ncbi:MAG: hypothetical protein U5J62_07515 [Desulfurivibrio sp.]|nr:hypothetical protein [Desulfurivibrio sp.]